jgi:hypothetical protein
MLYGDAVGKLFEAFYSERLWRQNVVDSMHLRVELTLQRIIQNETRKGGVFDWADPELKPGTRSLEEVEAEVRETIPRGLRSIKHHSLMGQDAAAEVKLDQFTNGHQLAGRADFLMRRVSPHKDLIILDGKGSRWRDKYVSRTQLLWYSMLYWMQHNTLPDRLGFLFWRFDPSESVDWSEVRVSEVQSLQTSALTAIESIEQATKELVQLRLGEKDAAPGMLFWANPSSECKLCSYQSLCPEGRAKPPKGEAFGVEAGDFSF